MPLPSQYTGGPILNQQVGVAFAETDCRPESPASMAAISCRI
jgi:hypothetical protein